jgi:Kef-type K+ transport system membrane component KefB
VDKLSMPNLDFTAFLVSGDARIPLSMLIVFGAAKLLAEVFERLNQPGIVGEILAGVLIGPSVLAWIQPSDLLGTLSDLGVMFLLFRVGLEVKSSELLRVGGTAMLVATIGVIVPFLMGWGLMLAWGYGQSESVFVGAAMVATSVGITAQVLSAKGLLHLTSSKIILAAAVIDDVLGLLVLALVSSATRGKVNILEIGLTVLLAVLFVVAVAKWGTATMGRVVPKVKQTLRVAEAEFALAMVLLFALSVVAVYAGVAAIVGAFLAGMALGESVGERVKHLANGTAELLVPFFLAGIGLHVNLSAFSSSSMMSLAVLLLLAAVVSKFVGCGLGAFTLGRTEMTRIGVGMIPRGEVGMVVAQLGLVIGVISQPVYGVVVFMAVATTIVAPPLLSMAYRGAKAIPVPEEEVLRLG